MRPQPADFSALLDIVARLKDDVAEIMERTHADNTDQKHPRRIAPGHSPDEPWSPCDRAEVTHYAHLSHLH